MVALASLQAPVTAKVGWVDYLIGALEILGMGANAAQYGIPVVHQRERSRSCF